MFNLTLTDSPILEVRGRKHNFEYAIDGSKPNPLESTYAALAGCAGVYTLKACKKLGKSAEGIQISARVVVKPENPTIAQKWMTTVSFTSDWKLEDKQLVIEEMHKCAVKELLMQGSDIEFITEEINS